MRGKCGGGVATQVFIFAFLAVLLCATTPVLAAETADAGLDVEAVSGAAPAGLHEQEQRVGVPDDLTCNSLTGPFCLHTGSVDFYAAYMTPISPLDLDKPESKPAAQEPNVAETTAEEKSRQTECFFQHFASSWMDSGGTANDLISHKVGSVDECERQCCEHAKCRSFTFWRGHTCFLRAQTTTPRADDDSFSGVRLI